MPGWVGRKIKKDEMVNDINDIINNFFPNIELPENELMRLSKNTLANLHHVLITLKQKRISDYK